MQKVLHTCKRAQVPSGTSEERLFLTGLRERGTVASFSFLGPVVSRMSSRKEETNSRNPGYQKIIPSSTESSVSGHRDTPHPEATNLIRSTQWRCRDPKM